MAIAVAENNSVEEMSLRGNKINGRGIDALKRALETNMKMQRFLYDKQELSIEESALHPETQELTLEDELGEFAHLFAQTNQNRKPRVEQILDRNRQQLFQQILGAGETWPWMKTNMVVVGAERSGKSSTVRSLQGGHASDHYTATVGVLQSRVLITQYDNWKLDSSNSNVEPFAYQRYVDMAGRGRKNLEYEQPKPGSLREYEATVVRLPLETANALASQYVYNETKAEFATLTKHHIKMNVWDLSGNPKYADFQEIFLRRAGIGLVVFDMCRFKEKNDEEAVAEIETQLNALRLHSPEMKIFLVGTNLDRVPELEALVTFEEEDDLLGEEEMISKVNGLLKDKLKIAEDKQVVQGEDEYGDPVCFWALSNKEGKGINQLLDGLRGTVNSLDSLQTRVSVRWLHILDLWSKEATKVISLKKALEIGKKCGADSAEVDRMIHVFHLLGSIVNVASMDSIVTNPQWLSDRLARMIRDLKGDPFTSSQMSRYKFTDAHAAVLNDGFWTPEILRQLWNDDPSAEFLVSFAVDQLMLGKAATSHPPRYVVVSTAQSMEAKNLQSSVSPTPQLSVVFKRYSVSLYNRLVAACLNHGKGKGAAEFASDGVKLFLGSTQVVLCNNLGDSKVDVHVAGSETATVQKTLEQMMKHVQEASFGATVDFAIQAA